MLDHFLRVPVNDADYRQPGSAVHVKGSSFWSRNVGYRGWPGANLALALGAYNAGPGKVDEAGGIPAIPETTSYVDEILGRLGLKPPAVGAPILPGPDAGAREL